MESFLAFVRDSWNSLQRVKGDVVFSTRLNLTSHIPIVVYQMGKVGSSSLGEKAGLRQGDIITEVNLRPIHNAEDLENALSALTVGSRVVIIFLRGQETLKSEIVA